MIHALFVCLTVHWLLIGSAFAQVTSEEPSLMADIISQVMADGTPAEAVDRMLKDCGQPQVVIMPPRPGEPLQERLVSRLDEALARVGINFIDGERVNADQAREADLAYSRSSDAAAATRILLARNGDYELKWSIDVSMEGPLKIYGVETWEAKVDLHATLVDLLTGDEIDSIAVTEAARQQTRERALDQSIENVILTLAEKAALPVLRSWYGMASGVGFVQVRVSADAEHVDDIQQQLTAIAGVRSVTRGLPLEPPRLIVQGSKNARELSNLIGQGDPVSCRNLVIESESRSLGMIWVGLIGAAILIGLIIGKERIHKGLGTR